MTGNQPDSAYWQQKLWLPASLALNGLLLLLVIFLLLQGNRPETAESTPLSAVATSTSTLPALPTATETAVSSPSPFPPSTATAIATPLPPATSVPTETPFPTPEATATIMPEPPAETAVPSPTPVPVVSGPDWLLYFNAIRAEGGLPAVAADALLSFGAELHSEYMIRTNSTVHAQEPSSPLYTREGNHAGQNGNIAASGWAEAPANWGLEYWMTAPFHMLPMLNPRLETAGYGFFRDAGSDLKMTATLDVKSGLGNLPDTIVYPLTFPKDGGQTWSLESRLPEFPSPLVSCPGYTRPVGAPLIVQIGPGDQTPVVTGSSVQVDGAAVSHCVLTEANYYNESSYQQGIGRNILGQQDAIVLIPRSPLLAGKTYAVRLVVNGAEIAWQFNTVARR